MPTYKNFQAFAVQQLKNLNDATSANRVLREAVIGTAYPALRRRIQNDGENSAGAKMVSKTAERYGAYSKAYGKRRERKGRQTAIVDLTMDGDMMRSLKPGPTGPNSYGIGFLHDEQAEIAAYNEENFGPVFSQAETEKNDTLKEINRIATKFLSR